MTVAGTGNRAKAFRCVSYRPLMHAQSTVFLPPCCIFCIAII